MKICPLRKRIKLIPKGAQMQGLSEQHENYLETKENVARVKDIASRLGVQSGTVTSALKSLSGKGLINCFITLTPGRKGHCPGGISQARSDPEFS